MGALEHVTVSTSVVRTVHNRGNHSARPRDHSAFESTQAALMQFDLLSNSMFSPDRTLTDVPLSSVSGRFDLHGIVSNRRCSQVHKQIMTVSTFFDCRWFGFI
jgi:hypothetical protein